MSSSLTWAVNPRGIASTSSAAFPECCASRIYCGQSEARAPIPQPATNRKASTPGLKFSAKTGMAFCLSKGEEKLAREQARLGLLQDTVRPTAGRRHGQPGRGNLKAHSERAGLAQIESLAVFRAVWVQQPAHVFPQGHDVEAGERLLLPVELEIAQNVAVEA